MEYHIVRCGVNGSTAVSKTVGRGSSPCIVAKIGAGMLELNKLNYDREALIPSISKINLSFHHDVLAKGYVDRFNANQGDVEFNSAGAKLHNLLFEQYK